MKALRAIRDLSPEEALLLVVGVSALAWMAIPARGPGLTTLLPRPESAREARGGIGGEVVRSDGEPVAGVPVGLFHGESLGLLELTRSDASGRFVLNQVPRTFHVLAVPEEPDALPGWLLDLEGGRDLDLLVVLPDALPIEVRVVAPDGSPVRGAEVRVYRDGTPEARPSALVDRARTDEHGAATLRTPSRAVLAAFADGYRPGWIIPGAVSEGVPVRLELAPAD